MCGWGEGDADRYRKYAAELVALAPDVILCNSATVVTALQRVTRTVPIVFAQATDPVGAGLIASLARPGGNVTGFTAYEYAISAKWLELLKQIAPGIRRVMVLRDVGTAAGTAQFAAIQAVAPSLRVELSPAGLLNADEIESNVAAFANGSDAGLIVTNGSLGLIHRALIIKLAARQRLPAVYSDRVFVSDGGMMSYGTDRMDQYRRAAGYIDRILKGERPADLPVQAPTKYELAINLKTAKALSLDVPATVLARADEVIE
jgi:putative ABC transport system substrate-binding protein